MKILKTLYKKINYIFKKYKAFKHNPLTKSLPIWYLIKYLIINFKLYVLNNEIVINYLNNIQAKVKKGDGIVGNYHSGLHEAQDSIFLMHLLREGDNFLDIGANVGHYTLLAGVYSKAFVTAIEPIPSTFERLKQNVSLNTWKFEPNLLNIGLSNEVGELVFTNQNFTTNKVSTSGNGIKINVDTLDSICSEKIPNVIKIDVEGYEYFVLSGGENVLASSELNVIVIELNESGKNFNIKDEQITKLLVKNGFKPYTYDVSSRNLEKITFKNLNQFNTIFIKDVNFVLDRVKNADKITINGKKL